MLVLKVAKLRNVWASRSSTSGSSSSSSSGLGRVGRGVCVGLEDRALEEVAQLGLAALLHTCDLDRFFGEADLSPAAVRGVEQREHVLKPSLPCL